VQINRERLAAIFTELCEIESPSRNEAEISSHLQCTFRELGAHEILIDESDVETGSNTGNLIVRFKGSTNAAPIFFCCHMDTVGPSEGIVVIRDGDIFRSGGNTILGADDKSGIAALVEMVTILRENSAPHAPFELLFTTCEEIGLLGAKAFDPKTLNAPYGYALDSTRNDKIITAAPAANRLKISIHGKAAHSGSAPEKGINALAVAADAITRLSLGRIDHVSTTNLGLVQGGTATNIIPETVVLEGEVRSHSLNLLQQHTDHITTVFKKVAENWPTEDEVGKPSVSVDIFQDFPLMNLDEKEPVLLRLQEAAKKASYPLEFDMAGGGSDANIFCEAGLKTAILPTGMANVHTTDEQVDLNDIVRLTALLIALVS